MIHDKNIAANAAIQMSKLLGGGMLSAADIHYVLQNDGATKAYFEGKVNEANIHSTIMGAHNNTVTGRNDVVLLSPDNHSQAAAMTWSRNMTHLIGMYPSGPMMNMRPRIGHSATVSPLLTVSGYGNMFSNLYFMYGSVGTDLNCLTISGARNSFDHCHFLPVGATALDEANFDLIRVTNNEHYFKSCFFGGDTAAWTNGNMIEFDDGGGDPPRTVFEDCIFLMYADNNQVTFMKVAAGTGRCLIVFRNCQFINTGTTMTLGIDGTGLNNAKMLFDSNCVFHGVTDVCTNGRDTNILTVFDYGGSTDANNLITGFADHT